MFDIEMKAGDKRGLYRELGEAVAALVAGERDMVANMANAAAAMFGALPDVNWVGFYRVINGELVLGPFGGKPACIRIPWGRGVCGTAAATGRPQRVDDVHAFPGHIACDVASRSELVVPVFAGDLLVAVLDLDSPMVARFDADDEAGCVALAQIVGDAWVG